MTKAEERALEAYPKDLQQLITFDHSVEWADANARDRRIYLQGYAQGEADQKEQMMKGGVPGRITALRFGNTIDVSLDDLSLITKGFFAGDKVKVIIVKENEK